MHRSLLCPVLMMVITDSKKVGGFATGRRTNRQNATLRYKNVYAASWAIKEGVEKFHRNV